MARAGTTGQSHADPLVSAAMRGDCEAIRTLWERHRRWVAAVLLSHKPVFEDLEDLLQEVALIFVSRIRTLRDEASLRPWLGRIAVNAARAAARSGRHRPRPSSALPEPITAFSRADEELSLDEHAQRMLNLVQQLPDAYRTPLLLRALQGMRSRQIAEILEIEPALVDTRIARARRMLREASSSQQTHEAAAVELGSSHPAAAMTPTAAQSR